MLFTKMPKKKKCIVKGCEKSYLLFTIPTKEEQFWSLKNACKDYVVLKRGFVCVVFILMKKI